MTDPERPPGTHRRTRNTNRLPVLITSLIAIAIVAVAVILTLNKRGEPAHSNAPTAAGSTLAKHTPSTSPPSSAISSAIPPSVTTSVLPSTAPPPTTPPPTTPAPSTPAPTTTPAQPALPALDVLNDSRITGLAARATEQFRAAGWKVATTGNFKGPDVPETTIFYPDGDKAAADRLARQFGIHRLRPATSDLSSSHLTVALARDWPDPN
jgi:hypothetical protein